MEALLKSLVGSSIEYRGSVRTIEDAAFKSRTLRTERDHIRKSLEMGSSLPEDVRLILYTELLDYYRNQPYYFEVRNSIVFGRDRAKVIDMLSRPSSERLDELEVRLSYGSKYPYREAIVCAFIAAYEIHKRLVGLVQNQSVLFHQSDKFKVLQFFGNGKSSYRFRVLVVEYHHLVNLHIEVQR